MLLLARYLQNTCADRVNVVGLAQTHPILPSVDNENAGMMVFAGLYMSSQATVVLRSKAPNSQKTEKH